MSDETTALARAEERITDLEVHLAHQSRLLEELDEIVRRQADEIDVLRRRLAGAVQRLSEMQNQGDAPPASQKPPHY